MEQIPNEPNVSPYKVKSYMTAMQMNGMEEASKTTASMTTNINTSVDNLEAKLDTVISLLTTANGYLQTIAAK